MENEMENEMKNEMEKIEIEVPANARTVTLNLLKDPGSDRATLGQVLKCISPIETVRLTVSDSLRIEHPLRWSTELQSGERLRERLAEELPSLLDAEVMVDVEGGCHCEYGDHIENKSPVVNLWVSVPGGLVALVKKMAR